MPAGPARGNRRAGTPGRATVIGEERWESHRCRGRSVGGGLIEGVAVVR
jgi:hypothetical protein